MWDPTTRTGTGVVFNDFDVPAVSWAIHTTLDLYKDSESWQQIIQNAMRQDFSWDKQGGEYEALYAQLTVDR
jgi:starch synthase